MKSVKYILSIVVIAVAMQSCKNETVPETKIVEVQEEASEKMLNPDAVYVLANFEIDGMTCAMGCAKAIEKNIAKMDGVKEVVVDFDSKTATVSYDEETVTRQSLIAAVKKTGDSYQVTSWNGTFSQEVKEIMEE